MYLVEIQKLHQQLKSGANESVVVGCGSELDYEKLFKTIYEILLGTEYVVTMADKMRLEQVIEIIRQQDEISPVDDALLEIHFGRNQCDWREYCRRTEYVARQNYGVGMILTYLRHSSAEAAVARTQRLLKKIYEQDKELVLQKNAREKALQQDASIGGDIYDGYLDE